MRGLGLKQKKIRVEYKNTIWDCIYSLNFQEFGRFATINDIHRSTSISKEIIRNHIHQMIKNKEIFQFNVGYNARGFSTFLANEQIKKDKEITRIILENTQYHIYKLKYPKPSKNNKPVKSSRDYGGLTERQEKKKIKIKK